ncbi:MAG: hypothetical protein OWQ54_09900 [Sulfolobaceae archaeon]|nr:hypothetical protein [Sulfolobaceae archaeon]
MISVEELKKLKYRGHAYQVLKRNVEKSHPDIAFSGQMEDVLSKVINRPRVIITDTERLYQEACDLTAT